MRLVRPGDLILHFVDNKELVGISEVSSNLITNFYCLPNTEWDNGKGTRPGYLIKLKNFQKFKYPIKKQDILNIKYKNRLLNLKNKGNRVFYNKKLNLVQGGYLTEVPFDLLEIINYEYKQKNDSDLPIEIYNNITRDENINDFKKENKINFYSEKKINQRIEKQSDPLKKIETYAMALRKNIKDFDGPFRDIIKYVPNFYELFESLLKEEKFDSNIRSIINSVVAYFVLPNDILSEEEYGAIGYIDDLYLCVYVLDKIYYEKDIIEKHWKEEIDVFKLANFLKNQIEKLPQDIIKKEQLNAVEDYIMPFIRTISLSKSEDETIEKISNKDEANENKIVEYDSDLYFVRETESHLELIDKKTGFPSLTLNRNTHCFKPRNSKLLAEKKIIEYDSGRYILKEDSESIVLIPRDTNEGKKIYNKNIYILIPKFYS